MLDKMCRCNSRVPNVCCVIIVKWIISKKFIFVTIGWMLLAFKKLIWGDFVWNTWIRIVDWLLSKYYSSCLFGFVHFIEFLNLNDVATAALNQKKIRFKSYNKFNQKSDTDNGDWQWKKNGSFKSNQSQCWIWIWKLWIRAANIIWEIKRTIYKHIHYTQDIWNSCIFFCKSCLHFGTFVLNVLPHFAIVFADKFLQRIHPSFIWSWDLELNTFSSVFFSLFLSLSSSPDLSVTNTNKKGTSLKYGIEWETNEYFTN